MSAGSRTLDPLARFLELSQALRKEHHWTQDWSLVRQAALALCTDSGSASAIAAATRAVAGELRQRAGWFGPLRSDARFLVAALLVQQDDEAPAFLAEVERAKKLFRAAKLARLGFSLAETLAILILRQGSPDHAIHATLVSRFASIYRALRADHPFLTDRNDYPACAMLCVASIHPPERIRGGVEALYKELARRRFSRGNPLQFATHLLFLGGREPERALERFERIWQTFKEKGLYMHQGDYDEVALLAALDASPREIVARVLSDRAAIAEQKPRPTKQTSFTFAAGTAFVALSGSLPDARRLAALKAILDVQTAIRQKEAAAASAAG